ncbi:helix-turn-helix domain-containing protein [Gilvimarinus sp. F26214L]|uniref:helix-turn-helix domain-containing protein n=1 Tax=Gilvimarinus sp. DZF01 TaxID=3461371 RepID=UPI004046600F
MLANLTSSFFCTSRYIPFGNPRAAADLSMAKLGEAVGVSPNMVKKYEHDQSMPSSPVLIKLADALHVRTEFFFRPSHRSLHLVGNLDRFSHACSKVVIAAPFGGHVFQDFVSVG